MEVILFIYLFIFREGVVLVFGFKMLLVLFCYLFSLREKKLSAFRNGVLNVNEAGERQLRICQKTYLKERKETQWATFQLIVIAIEEEK